MVWVSFPFPGGLLLGVGIGHLLSDPRRIACEKLVNQLLGPLVGAVLLFHENHLNLYVLSRVACQRRLGHCAGRPEVEIVPLLSERYQVEEFFYVQRISAREERTPVAVVHFWRASLELEHTARSAP